MGLGEEFGGRIVRDWQYYIECALCGDGASLAPYGSLAEARREARGVGWSKTVKHGWICPDCKEQGERHAG